jgi:HK97 family phage major capsid protein
MMSVSNDQRLRELRTQWDAKDAEANLLIADPDITREGIAKAETLVKQRDGIGKEITERLEDIGRLDLVKESAAGGQAWMNTPARGLPFNAEMGGRKTFGSDGASTKNNPWYVNDLQESGSTEFAWDKRAQHYRMVKEAGEGILNRQKKNVHEIISSMEYKNAFWAYIKSGDKMMPYVDSQYKILQEGMDDQGGVFAPAELIARIIGRLPAPTSLRALCTTFTTGRDKMIIPALQYGADDIYTTAFRATWTGEIPYDGSGNIATVNDQNLLGNKEIQVFTAMLNGQITRDLIEDSAFPIQAWFEQKLAEIVDLLYEDMILNGSTNLVTSTQPIGIAQQSQPMGILFGAAAGNTEGNIYPEVLLSATAGGLDYNSLWATQQALAPQYEVDSTRWVMQKRSTYAYIGEIKDTQNRPLFTTGYEDSGMVGRRGRVLFGDPINLSQFMPPISSSNFPIIYGDIRGHYLAQRVGFSIQVLDQTKAKQNQIELVGRIRFGGRTIEPWRLKILKSNNS